MKKESFKLLSVKFHDKSLQTETIKFINKDHFTTNSNYYTLIIGNNGTGKSRILSKITRFFNDKNKDKNQLSLFPYPDIEYVGKPEKIISITQSISDKFPNDKSFRPSRYQKEVSKNYFYRDLYYNYLGARNRLNSFSSTSLINRALDIVLENYSELRTSKNYRYIFDYLNYEPILKLRYRLSYRTSGLDPTPDGLKSYIQKLRENTYVNPDISNISKVNLKKLSRFIISNKNSEQIEMIINFSKKNIKRIQNDYSIYEEKMATFEMISQLIKLRIIRNSEITVYKKEGEPFSFRDASSGEANILSTLLSLVPLLRENSLVLIDEPEISLHPLWQAKYVDLLRNIFANVSGCHIIIASHSPFLASSLEPDNSSLISLTNVKGIIKSRIIEESTYGWAVDDILLDVFNLPTTRNFNLYSEISKALNLLNNPDYSKGELKKLQLSLSKYTKYIKASDPIKSVIDTIINIDNGSIKN